MTARDTRKAFLKLLDDTWPGVRSEFVAAMKSVQSQADMRALEAAIARGDVDAAFRALRFDAADMFRTDTESPRRWRLAAIIRWARFSTPPAARRLPSVLCSHSEAGMSGPSGSRGTWARGW